MSSRASLCLPVLCWLGLSVSVPLGGESDAQVGSPVSRSAEATSPSSNEAELIEQLSAIGYLAGTEPAHASQGVTLHDAQRTAPGLNLLTSGHGPVALLMDMEGAILHEWRAEFAQVFPDHPKIENGKAPRRNYWRVARLLPDGSIVAIWELFGLFKLDRNSQVLWAVAEPVHHALQLTGAGEIAHLQAKRKMVPEIADKKAIEDFIVVRNARGEELRRLAISDALQNVHWTRLRKAFWTRDKERGYGLGKKSLYDPFHTNSLWLLSSAEAARLGAPFEAGDALVSMAMLDTVAILDMNKGVTRWSQQGPFGMQHEPRPTLDGRIILFNNFLSAERSSVLTLDPRSRSVTQEYTGPEAAPIHSRRSGRVQVLPNGNILIVETDGGRALEITASGEEVWEYRSPFRAGEAGDKVAGLYSMERVDRHQTAWLNAKSEVRLEPETSQD